MRSKGEQVRDKAVELLRGQPNGVRRAQLLDALQGSFPDTPRNSMPGSIWNLDARRSRDVHKPSRGLFKYRFLELTGCLAQRYIW